jgi:hypothetical protein
MTAERTTPRVGWNADFERYADLSIRAVHPGGKHADNCST